MNTALQRKSLRFRSFLWSQRWICYCEKVGEYREFFLKEPLIEHLGLVDGSENFLRFSGSIQIEKNWLNFVIELKKHQVYQVSRLSFSFFFLIKYKNSVTEY